MLGQSLSFRRLMTLFQGKRSMAIHIRQTYRQTGPALSTRTRPPVQPLLVQMLGAASALCLMMGTAWAQGPDAPAIEEVLVVERSIENTLPLELARYGAELEIVTSEIVRNHGFVDVAQSLE